MYKQLVRNTIWVVGMLYDDYGVESEKPIDMASIRIAIPLPENTMVQINNSEYDGSTRKKALKILIPSEERST